MTNNQNRARRQKHSLTQIVSVIKRLDNANFWMSREKSLPISQIKPQIGQTQICSAYCIFTLLSSVAAKWMFRFVEFRGLGRNKGAQMRLLKRPGNSKRQLLLCDDLGAVQDTNKKCKIKEDLISDTFFSSFVQILCWSNSQTFHSTHPNHPNGESLITKSATPVLSVFPVWL